MPRRIGAGVSSEERALAASSRFCCVSPVRFASSCGCSECVIAFTLAETSWETKRMFVSSSLHAARSAGEVSMGAAGVEVAVTARGCAFLPPQPASSAATPITARTRTTDRRIGRA